MNVQNVQAIAETLKQLGFEDRVMRTISKYMLITPDQFCIHHKVKKAKDILNFQLYFKKDVQVSSYSLLYFDALFIKDIEIQGAVETDPGKQLEKRMEDVDWIKFFGSEGENPSNDLNETKEELEKIETILKDLNQLESSEKGKEIASQLKVKFWADLPGIEIFYPINSLKAKYEICQRFYMLGDQGISVDEAFRFLNNLWMEKQMLARRKEVVIKSEQNGGASKGNGKGTPSLLPKKFRKGNRELIVKKR